MKEATEFARRLRTTYLKRNRVNPNYSLRAFARDLSVSPAFLSMVLSGKKLPSYQRARQMSVMLRLPGEEREDLLQALNQSRARGPYPELYGSLQANGHLSLPKSSNYIDIEEEEFEALSIWYFLAIVELSLTEGFKAEPAWVARRLGIQTIEARDALERLVALGWLERRDGKLIKKHPYLKFKSRRSREGFREHHRQMLGKAQEELGHTADVEFKRREISSTTMAVNRDQLERARSLILEFKQLLCDLLTQGPADEVYQFNVQLFPLTRKVEKA